MLQAGALGSSDYQLRIPTKIRQLEILDAKPALAAGSESESLARFPVQAWIPANLAAVLADAENFMLPAMGRHTWQPRLVSNLGADSVVPWLTSCWCVQ